MPFFKLRLSLEDNYNETLFDPSNITHIEDRARHLRLLKQMCKDKQFDAMTLGFETKNKYGEPCRPHLHFHFEWSNPELVNPKRTLAEYLKNRANQNGIVLKGNKKWCLQLVDDPTDWDRFFRYPFKFGTKTVRAFTASHFPPPWLAIQIPIAVDENNRRITANLLHRDKVLEKVTFKDKLFKHLDSIEGTPTSDRDVWLAIAAYYVTESKPINFQTIAGYTTLYRIHVNAITLAQAYEMRSNST